MNGSRSRVLLLAGPLFALVFIVMAFVVEGSTPGEEASAAKVLTYYTDHKTGAASSAFLAPAAAALIVLFFAQLRTLARERVLAVGAGPTVMMAGAVLWASGLLLASTVQLALVTAADHHQAQVAQTLNVIDNDDWIPFITGIAVTLVGSGITVLTTGVLPRWLGWTALVVGVLSLAGPGGFLGFFVGPLWVLVAGVVAFTRSASGAPTAEERAPVVPA